MPLNEHRDQRRPENKIATALVGLLGATHALATLAGSDDTLSLLAKEEFDTGEITLARNRLNRVLQRIDSELEHNRRRHSEAVRAITRDPARRLARSRRCVDVAACPQKCDPTRSPAPGPCVSPWLRSAASLAAGLCLC